MVRSKIVLVAGVIFVAGVFLFFALNKTKPENTAPVTPTPVQQEEASVPLHP